jgi:hypothetical protein
LSVPGNIFCSSILGSPHALSELALELRQLSAHSVSRPLMPPTLEQTVPPNRPKRAYRIALAFLAHAPFILPKIRVVANGSQIC